jgi:endonuclease YncB( thermonuclease family)
MALTTVAAVVSAFLFIQATEAQALTKPITGPSRVIDGDTIALNKTRIRLHGIDAPEANQICTHGTTSWPCGTASTNTLKKLIGTSEVTCVKRDVDRYGRIVAVCSANGVDLNARMVSLGMAVAYRKYSKDYVGHEASAKAARMGLWSGMFVMPWDWRRGKRLSSITATNDNSSRPTGCQIKGNISSKGERIYHTPGSRWYAKTVVSVGKGERWFCTEVEAKGAGWRKAGSRK